jgi:hypothetical protein
MVHPGKREKSHVCLGYTKHESEISVGGQRFVAGAPPEPPEILVRRDAVRMEVCWVGTPITLGWCSDESRPAALARLGAGLSELTILGVPTTQAFARDALAHPQFRDGKMMTGFR